MRKMFFVTLILLIAVGWAVAQNPSTPPMSEQPGAQSPSNQSPSNPGAQSPTSPSAQPGAPGQQPGMPGATTQPGTPADQAGQDASAAAAGSTIEGCLGGSGSNFTVADKSGTTYQLQLPAGADSSKLSAHVGEEVRVTGTTSNTQQSSASSSASGSASASTSQPSIAVTKIDKVGDKCGSGAQAPPTSH